MLSCGTRWRKLLWEAGAYRNGGFSAEGMGGKHYEGAVAPWSQGRKETQSRGATEGQCEHLGEMQPVRMGTGAVHGRPEAQQGHLGCSVVALPAWADKSLCTSLLSERSPQLRARQTPAMKGSAQSLKAV